MPRKKHGKQGWLKTNDKRLELTYRSHTTKERVSTKQQRSWTTEIFNRNVASKERTEDYAEKKENEAFMEQKGRGEEQQGHKTFSTKFGKN